MLFSIDFPGTIAGGTYYGTYCWEHMDYRTWLASSLEERVVAAEVASRRADGSGVIEVQSQRRSGVAGQGLGPGTQWRGRPVRPGTAPPLRTRRHPSVGAPSVGLVMATKKSSSA
eukprot:SAG11_NODE_1096_length_5884_cov_4.310631_5_plen_115_part_00